MSAVYIGSEYGKLKEVIVGIAAGMTPPLEAKWLQEALKVLPPEECEYTYKHAGMTWCESVANDRGETEYDLLEAESLEFIKILESLGVKVYRPTELTKEDVAALFGKEALVNGYAQTFPRDNVVIVGDNVIETNLRTPLRRVDITGFRDILTEKCGAEDFKGRWIAMPHVPLLGSFPRDTPLLEGGDVIVIGKTILVGNSQNPEVGSNEPGYKWLRNYLGDGYEVVRVPLRQDVLHLDCALSIPRRGLAILCEDAFVEGIPAPLRDWDIIKMEFNSVKYLSLNGLPIDSKTYVMGYNDKNPNAYLKGELEARGIKVHTVFFGMHNTQGGSLRCATQALLRIDE
ncbi:MAG: hypothetical protein Q4F74_05685 [Synergistaceae bacterium]|nr:hypothetical protein [Synergistaceae bacterium]